MAPKKAKKNKKTFADDGDGEELELGDIPAAQAAPKPKAAAKKKKGKKQLQAGDWSDEDADNQSAPSKDEVDDKEPPVPSRKASKATAAFAMLQASPASGFLWHCQRKCHIYWSPSLFMHTCLSLHRVSLP